MPSIKCSQCNLVNYSTETHCKRCRNPLSDYAPFSEQRPYQTNFEQTYQTQPFQQQQNAYQNQPAQYNNFQAPPSPAYYSNQYQPQQFMSSSCIKCGERRNVSMHNFKKPYVPPLAYLALLIGLLPGMLIILLIKVRHQLQAPFCDGCWSKFNTVSMTETISALFFLFGVIAALFFGVGTESFVIFCVIFALACGVLILGNSYSRKHNLKYKKVNSRQVIVTDPLNGDVSLAG
jgi:hypothetical protein